MICRIRGRGCIAAPSANRQWTKNRPCCADLIAQTYSVTSTLLPLNAINQWAMADHEQRLEMHKDAIRGSQAHTSEIGTEWSTWRTLPLPMFRNLLVADLVSDV